MSLYSTYCALERRMVPGLRSSQREYYEVLRERLHAGIRWLDTGCGHQILPTWLPTEEQELLGSGALPFGIDRDLEALRRHQGISRRVFGDLRQLPFEDRSFEVLAANMVVEHVDDPLAVLREMRRVLVPGGSLVFHTVNRHFWAVPIARIMPDRWKRRLVAVLEKRSAEDVFPTYYRLNSARDIAAVATAAGLETQRISYISSTAVLSPFGLGALPELTWISLLRWNRLARLRSNLIVVLGRPLDDTLPARV